jgi:hypothetical protein
MALPLDIDTFSELTKNSQPDSEKQKGNSKFGKILINNALELSQTALPIVLSYAQQLNIDPNGNSIPDVCPTIETINKVLPPLNNIISTLNSSAQNLDKISQVLTLTSVGASTLQSLADTITTLLPPLQIAIQAIPPPGLPGAIVGAVDVLDFVNKNIIFTSDGTPRIPPLLASVGAAGIGIAILSTTIDNITSIINKIISLIQKCSPESSINTLSSTVLQISNSVKQTKTTSQQTIYQGFSFELEEKNYTPTVKQYRAVGKNSQGITLISTPYSFTNNPQVLINELKLIIDRDNLKAY